MHRSGASTLHRWRAYILVGLADTLRQMCQPWSTQSTSTFLALKARCRGGPACPSGGDVARGTPGDHKQTSPPGMHITGRPKACTSMSETCPRNMGGGCSPCVMLNSLTKVADACYDFLFYVSSVCTASPRVTFWVKINKTLGISAAS